jgi:CubicO group peptidase (beta-lactamase class C family)
VKTGAVFFHYFAAMLSFSFSLRLKNKILICWLFCLFLFSCKNQSPAQAGDTALPGPPLPSLSDSLAGYLDTFLPSQRFSGGILVVKNGQTLYERYMGFADADKQQPITDTTPFHVASTSKTVTSTAVLQLVAAGKINLQDPVTKFFPAFPYKPITVRHLLTHTSGLRNYAYFFPLAKWNKKITATNRDVLDVMITNKPALEFPTGAKFHYSNTNFSLLALIVEEASKLPFPDYVQQYIFNRCGMSHSYILSVRNEDRYMPSWKANGKVYNFEYLDAIYGDKNLYTTCRDLRNYDSAIQRNVLLPQSLYDSAWQPISSDSHYQDTIEYYGLGWRIKNWPNGNKIVYHNGWWHGNNAVFQRVYQDTAVIIVTGNVFNSKIYSLGRLANFFRTYYERRPEKEIPENEDISVKKEDTTVSKKEKVKSKKVIKTQVSKKQAKKKSR